MQSKGRLKIFRRPFLMPAYFHFSNTPSLFNRHTHRIPFFAHLSLPYSLPLLQQIESLPHPATAARPVFPIFQTTPIPFRKQGRLKLETDKTQTTKNRASKRGRF